ncbi:T9SS type A sorting domain-containing protein [Pedobacter alpinus]|uniref:T9SS type A sorting domain-containing protein n=1 Tax=Pedobacter alpinus TaxID=1590643 RepID=A0ABW5TLK9_9SPHI
MNSIFTCKSFFKFRVHKVLISLFALIFASINVSAQLPTISSFSPLSVKPGDVVTIAGTNFNTTTANNVVFFGATKATVTAATATSLTVTVPTGATYAPITLLNTANSLVAQSSRKFNPIFSPAKANITTSDFSPKQDFTTGTNPFSVAIGDLDGDGKSDLVVANLNSSNVSIYRNTSTSGDVNSGSFAAKVDFEVRFSPVFVTISDIDGDGKPDLGVVNQGSNSISILRNTSTSGSITSSSFATKVDFNTDGSPATLAISDLDGDGKPDLLVTNQFSNIVSVYRNTSTSGSITTGSFAAKVDFPTEDTPVSVAVGDLDGDNKVDFVVANRGSNNVSVYRNISTSGSINSGSFATKVNFTTDSNPFAIAIGDLDGDGKPDLAVANRGSNNVSILHNTSSSGSITSSSFAAKVDFTTASAPFSINIGDLDGDSKPDLAVANSSSASISIFRNTSASGSITTSSFAAKVDFATGDSPLSVAIGDLDGDSKADLAVANLGSNSVSVFRNTDVLPPTITSFTPLSAKPGDAVTITGANFNTTTTNNVVFFGATRAAVTAATATSLTVTVPTGATYAPITVLNTGSSLVAQSLSNFNPVFSPAKTNITASDFSLKQDFGVGSGSQVVLTGDLDGDGKSDLLVRGTTFVSVFRNTTSVGSITGSSFGTRQDFEVGSFNVSTSEPSLTLGDLDGDGKLDLVAVVGRSTVGVFRNTSTSGMISFGTRQDFAAADGFLSVTSVAVGDLDLDGKIDIAAGYNDSFLDSDIISIFHNTSSGTISFSTRQDIPLGVGTNISSLAIQDIDGDQKPELIALDRSENQVSVIPNTSSVGSISFGAKQDYATLGNEYLVKTADIDGDGKQDILVSYLSTVANVSVLLNTSSVGAIGFLSRQDVIVAPSAAYGFGVGDVDGDGKPDVVTANPGSDLASVFRNTSTSGSVSFAAAQAFTTGDSPRSVVVSDLDGDGKSDITTANITSNTVSVLRNTDAVLPVSLVSYQAKLQTNGTVQLNWLTASETNNSHFEVLRSTDGINFNSIGKVTGAGNSTQQKTYNFIDPIPTMGNNYYQLIQHDNDGKQTDLGIRVINVSLKEDEVIIYPNPSSGLITVSFEAGAYQKLELIDLSGRVLISKSILKQNSEANLDLTSLATGIYSIKLSGEGKIVSKQIIKQ